MKKDKAMKAGLYGAVGAAIALLIGTQAFATDLPDGWLPKFYNGMEAVGSVSWVPGAYKGKVGAIRMAWESGAMKFGAAKEVTTDLTGWVDWTIEAHVKSEGDYGYAGAAMEFFDERGKSLGVVSAKRPSVAKEWRKLEWTFSAPRNAKRHVAHVLSLHREPVMFAKVRVTAKPGVDKGEIPYEVAALPAEWNKDWNGGTVRMLSFSDAPLPLSFFIKGAPRGSKGLELAVDIPAELELKDAFCPHCIHYEALRPSAEPFVTNGTDYVRYVFRDPKFLKGIKPGQFMVDNGLSVTAVIGPKPGNERLEKSFRILYRLRLGGKRGQEKALDLAFRPLPVGLGRAKDFPVFSWNNTDRHFSSDAAAHAALRAYEAAGVASFRRTLSGTLVLPRHKELVALCESRPARYIFSGRIGDVWKLGPCGLGRAKAKELGVRMAVSSDAAYADCVKDRMCPEYFTTDPRLRAHLREHVRGILSASGVKDGDWVTFDMEPWHSATWCHCEACHRAFAAFAKLDHVPTAAETQTEALRDRWALFRCSHNAKSVEMLAGIIHEYKPNLRCVDYDYVMPYGDEAGMMARRRACGKDTLVNERWLDGHECSYYHKIGIESFRSMRNDVRHLKKFYVPVAALSGYGTYLRPGEVLNPRQIRQFALAAFVNGCRGYAFYSGVCYDGEVLVEMMKAQDEIARWEGLPWGKSDGGVVPTSASGQFAFASTVKPDGTTVLALFNYDAEEKVVVSFADRTCELEPLDVRFVEVK